MIELIAIFSSLGGFIGAIIASRFPSWVRFSQGFPCVMLGLAMLCSLHILQTVAFNGSVITISLMTWITCDSLSINWALQFDTLSALMVAVVNTISFLVHLYSLSYMRHDSSLSRFMAYLSFFTFMMLMLVTAANFGQLFFGWEGVGLASYLLIGFWYDRPTAPPAALKAFVVNRVGDLGLILGIACIYLVFGTLDFSTLLPLVEMKKNLMFSVGPVSLPALELICGLLFIGAMGKSAQIGLHVWLPDAMEGPTPVSALIHAATMVTAGIFLVVRCSPLFQAAPHVLEIMVYVGASTAFFAGTVALVQTDIKRVIAYSTCSQLGYMFFAAGLSAYHLAMFHLVTHAFFKALLFLGAGAVIHAMSDEQDMRAMGGLNRLIPVTYLMMIIGSVALAGIPYFSGYYSKDAILEAAWATSSRAGTYAYVMGIVSAFLTALYSWRLLYLTFTGKPRSNEMVISHIHEADFGLLGPLFILAVGAIFGGYYGYPYFTDPQFWGESLVFNGTESAPVTSIFLHHLPTFCVLAGIGVAALLYYSRWSSLPDLITTRLKTIYTFLEQKWYFDALYQRLFIQKSWKIGTFFGSTVDKALIDTYGPDGVAVFIQMASRQVSKLQTGLISHYAYGMGLGIAMILGWIIFKAG